jgi:hypothetical protein
MTADDLKRLVNPVVPVGDAANPSPPDTHPLLPPSTVNDINEYVSLQQQELLKLLQPLQDAIGSNLTAVSSGLNTLAKPLQRQIKSRVNAQQNALDELLQPLHAAIANGLSEQQVKINHATLRLPVPESDRSLVLPNGISETGTQAGLPSTTLHNGSTKPIPRPPSTIVFPPHPVHPQLPDKCCPKCGTVIVQLQPSVQVDCTAIAIAIAQVSQNVAIANQFTAYITNILRQLIQVAVQVNPQISIQLPPEPVPPAPPPPQPVAQQIGKDCGHPMYICLCGNPSDPRCLGSSPDVPINFMQVVPSPPDACLLAEEQGG